MGTTIETFLSFTHTTESAEILHLPNKEVFRRADGGRMGRWWADGQMVGGWADGQMVGGWADGGRMGRWWVDGQMVSGWAFMFGSGKFFSVGQVGSESTVIGTVERHTS